jgi:hypothetical protein
VKAEALEWLLEPSDPPIRALTLTEVLGKRPDDPEVKATRESSLSYRPVVTLERRQGRRGYWPPDDTCYNPKFTATVWQLMLLGEMWTPRTPWIESAVERFIVQHQMENGAFCWRLIGGRGKQEEEPCLTGNMLRTMLVFGYGDDPRVKKGLDWMPEHQQKDGGWNCDYPSYSPTHSSFMSTIEPLWAYSEVPKAKWTRRMKSSIEGGAEFLLAHRLYKSHRDWRPVEFRGMHKIFGGGLPTKFHFPMYYYYDALHALRILVKLGYQDDERIGDAVHLMLSKKTPDGRWLLEGDWVRERKDAGRKTLVTIERLGKPSKWVTLNCYRVLAKNGGLELPQ